MRNRILQRLEDKKRRRFAKLGGTVNTNMYYQDGGEQQLPGGMVSQIPGSDAVEFSGQSHAEGGIMMDDITEVEDGETMDQVTMAKQGGKRDYFFSSHLKKGGRSFADMHKEILEDGGDQNQIDYLAQMQEKSAGRNPDNVQTARLGGVMKYQEGGPDYTKISTQDVASEEYYNPEEYGDIAATQHSKTFTLDSGEEITLYGDDHLFEQIEQTGTDAWLKNMYDNADPEVMEAAGITSYEQMGSKESNLKYQKAWNAANPENAIKEDSLFGEQTTRTMFKKAEEEPAEEEVVEEESKEETEVLERKKKDWSGSLLGLGSMIPAVMAFTDKPDYMDQPDLMTPGIVKAERVAKHHLDRVDFNDQLARNASDATAVNKAIDTSGGGPASMANRMSMYAAKQKGDREIKAQEARANVAIANEEAALDNKRKVFNSEAALDASKHNVSSQQKAEMTNIANDMYVDEFNRGADAASKDRKLNAVQYGINTLAQLHRDKLMYKASGDYANAIDGQRDALERFNAVNAKRGGYRQLKRLRK